MSPPQARLVVEIVGAKTRQVVRVCEFGVHRLSRLPSHISSMCLPGNFVVYFHQLFILTTIMKGVPSIKMLRSAFVS